MNEQRVRQRISTIYDLAHGAQGEGKSISEYVKTLSKSVDIHTETMGSAADFNRDIGSI
ncbi:MAG: hypothetical protein GKR86_13480 [Ilumatobacter sp.]|nr:hypothetical protein [Ilumatobacter sp.]